MKAFGIIIGVIGIIVLGIGLTLGIDYLIMLGINFVLPNAHVGFWQTVVGVLLLGVIGRILTAGFKSAQSE